MGVTVVSMGVTSCVDGCHGGVDGCHLVCRWVSRCHSGVDGCHLVCRWVSRCHGGVEECHSGVNGCHLVCRCRGMSRLRRTRRPTSPSPSPPPPTAEHLRPTRAQLPTPGHKLLMNTLKTISRCLGGVRAYLRAPAAAPPTGTFRHCDVTTAE